MKIIATQTISGARKRQNAFSLVEVLVAVLVTATGGVSVFAAFASGFGMIGSTGEDLRATQIMTRKIEGIRLCTWSQLPSTMQFHESYNPLGTTNAGINYSGTLTTNSAAGLFGTASYADNTRLVTVNVSWTNYTIGRPIAHSRQMQTVVARYGMQK